MTGRHSNPRLCDPRGEHKFTGWMCRFVCLPRFSMHLMKKSGNSSLCNFQPSSATLAWWPLTAFPPRITGSSIFQLVADNLLRRRPMLLHLLLQEAGESSLGKDSTFWWRYAKMPPASCLALGRQWASLLQSWELAPDSPGRRQRLVASVSVISKVYLAWSATPLSSRVISQSNYRMGVHSQAWTESSLGMN